MALESSPVLNKSIAKNTSYLSLALSIQKLISFFYFFLLARFLAIDELGKYYLVISFTSIFSVILDFGFNNLLSREIAKDESKAQSYLENILALKTIFLFLSFIFITILARVFYEAKLFPLILISSLSMSLDSFTASNFSLIRGFRNLKYESISSVIFQLIVLALGSIVLIFKPDLYLLLFSILIASLSNFIYSNLVLRRYFKLKWKPVFLKEKARAILKISWPFALYNIWQRLFTYLDSLLLGFKDYAQVGLYQIAFKLIFALQFIPMAFTAALYPSMSDYWGKRDRLELKNLLTKSINYLTIIALPMLTGIFFLAPEIVKLFSLDPEAIPPLRVSIIALFFIFLNFPFGSLLNACDKQRRNTRNMAIVTIFSLSLNLILIRHYLALGASITALLSNVLLLTLSFLSSRKLLKFKLKESFIIFLKSVFASIMMAFLIILLKDALHLFLVIPCAGLIYLIFLILTRTIKEEEFYAILKSLRK